MVWWDGMLTAYNCIISIMYGGREGSPAAVLEKPRGKCKGRAVNVTAAW